MENQVLDLEMPISIVTKLIKDGQSEEGSVILGKDVKKAFSQIAGLFVLYLHSTANDITKEKKMKKITDVAVYQALNELGFEKYQDQLREFMRNYSEKEDEVKKAQYKKRKLEDNGAVNHNNNNNKSSSNSKNGFGVEQDENVRIVEQNSDAKRFKPNQNNIQQQ